MSIDDLIADRVGRGMLFPLIPSVPGISPRRAMLIAEDLWDFLHAPGPNADWDERKGRLQADLEFFAEGLPIGPKYLFLLSPARECVWEIRSTRPDPSIRVLGCFIRRNVFVATNFALRGDLGGWESRSWRDAKITSRVVWARLFHPYQPLMSVNVGDVVSGALDGKYFKGP